METLRIKLLGEFSASFGEGDVLPIKGRKTQALLAVLALSAGSAIPREKLTSLLWSDREDEQARGSLRQALAELRKALGDDEAAYLTAERDSITLNGDDVECDAVKLERPASMGSGEDPAALYSGELLDGIGVTDPAFEEWLSETRPRYRELAQTALNQMLEQQTKAGDTANAILTARKLLSIDPLQESVHRSLMQLYANQDDRSMALKQYQACRDVLQNELSIEPEAETEALRSDIQQGGVNDPPDEGKPSAASEVSNPLPLPDKPSIAVLPFTNMSGDAEQEYFADGITEDIITELCRFQSLFVIARNSSFAFKGQAIDVIEIGKKLGVQFIVEGSVRKAGERIRITVQLIETSTGNHLWAERYDRNLSDIFAVQDEVVSQIATMVPGHVEITSRVQAERKPARDMNAYDLVLRAESILYHNYSSREGEQLLKQALEIDPGYARAHAKLASFYSYSVFAHGLDIDKGTALTRIHAETALKLNPGDPEVLATVADAYLQVGEHALAGHHLDRAIALNPNGYTVMAEATFVKAYLGDYDDAVEWANKAALCDPYSGDAFREIYFEFHYLGGQYELALQQYVGWQDLPPHNYLSQAAALAQLGRLEEAREAVQQFEKNRSEGGDVEGIMRAYARMCARPEDAERWLDGFRKAGLDI